MEMKTARLLCLVTLLAVSGTARAAEQVWRGYYFSFTAVASLDLANTVTRLDSGPYCTDSWGNPTRLGCRDKNAGVWDARPRAECGWDYSSPFAFDMIKGLSFYDYDYQSGWPTVLPRLMHRALCGNNGGDGVSPAHWIDYSRFTATKAGWKYDSYSTVGYDWAPGYWKRDCGSRGVLVGISQTLYITPGLLCRPDVWNNSVQWDYQRNAPMCQVVAVGTSDTRSGNERLMDWDAGYVKAECPGNLLNGMDMYVNGVAVVPWTSKIGAILCCQY